MGRDADDSAYLANLEKTLTGNDVCHDRDTNRSKMLQPAMLNRVPFETLNKASAFPIVQLRRAMGQRVKHDKMKSLPYISDPPEADRLSLGG